MDGEKVRIGGLQLERGNNQYFYKGKYYYLSHTGAEAIEMTPNLYLKRLRIKAERERRHRNSEFKKRGGWE